MNLIKSSIRIIKKYQAETGAYIASPNLTIYRYSWFRDNSWIAHAMSLSGEIKSAERFHDWASSVIIKNEKKILRAINKSKKGIPLGKDFIHARYTIYGNKAKVKWSNFQLDGLGIWLWSISSHMTLTKKQKKTWIKAAGLVCDYLSALWKIPCYDLWEESPKKIYTSTLASIYGGLLSFSDFFPQKELKNTCKKIKDFVLKNNIYDSRLIKYVGSKKIDASLIICSTPFNLLTVNSSIMKKTVSKIVKDLKVTNGLRRYSYDNHYGGGEWIVVTCWLGLYYLEIGRIKHATDILKWIENQADENEYLPEQINPVDNKWYIKWKNKQGPPANPLLWSHAMYIILSNRLKRIKKG